MKSGSILPYQEAQINKVQTTKNLIDLYTDLIILPSSDVQASKGNAAGFIYLDDGITVAQPVARFDFSLFLGSETIDINIKATRSGVKKNTKEEQIGVIKVMWASNFGLDKIDFTAYVQTFDDAGKKKAKIALDAVHYDAVSDILVIATTYTSG